MAHDVFISHSSSDKTVADAACAALESAGIRCWVAPRDVQPGRSFAGEITRAIQHSKAMVLIFSAHSNNSQQVLREVQLAVEFHLHILQFRIEDVGLNDDLRYFLSTPHWLDALTSPLQTHLRRLEISIKPLIEQQTTGLSEITDRIPVPQPPRREIKKSDRVRRNAFGVGLLGLIAIGALAFWWFRLDLPNRQIETGQPVKKRTEAIAHEEKPESETKVITGTRPIDGGPRTEVATKLAEREHKEDQAAVVVADTRSEISNNPLASEPAIVGDASERVIQSTSTPVPTESAPKPAAPAVSARIAAMLGTHKLVIPDGKIYSGTGKLVVSLLPDGKAVSFTCDATETLTVVKNHSEVSRAKFHTELPLSVVNAEPLSTKVEGTFSVTYAPIEGKRMQLRSSGTLSRRGSGWAVFDDGNAIYFEFRK